MTSDVRPSTEPLTDDRHRVSRWRGVVAGLLAAISALAIGELVSGVVANTASPVLSVGEWVIDHVPPWVKEFAIRTFGTNDKPALIIGTVVALLVFASIVGALATRRLAIGIAGVALFGAIGAATALTRPNASVLAFLPSLLGAGVAIAVLVHLIRGTLRVGVRAQPATDEGHRDAFADVDRRRFLVSAAAVGTVAVGAGGAGKVLQRRFDVNAERSTIALPAPKSPASAVPAGVDLRTPGITPFTTSNNDFYRVDTALNTPQVSADTWRLRIHGMVDRELTFSYQDLLSRDLVERDITLVCVSNEVGGQYAGHARWLGVPLADLLREAGVKPGADQLVSRSVDGWTAGSPVGTVMDGRDALVAIGMNGEPLPVNHGFPARLVVPGLYGYVSATKWVTELELTTFEAYNAYWVQRTWAQQAPIKTLTRIDTPQGLSSPKAGKLAIGGVAWAIHRGVQGVEVKIDDGPWQPARLGEVPTNDTWRQWVLDWDATPGSHAIVARATDGTGTVQTADRANPIPDGASGWHSIIVLVQ